MTCNIVEKVKQQLDEWEELHRVVCDIAGVAVCYEDVQLINAFHKAMEHIATELTKKLGGVAEIKWYHPVTKCSNQFDDQGYFAVVNKKC